MKGAGNHENHGAPVSGPAGFDLLPVHAESEFGAPFMNHSQPCKEL
jgi:hypothetical protein